MRFAAFVPFLLALAAPAQVVSGGTGDGVDAAAMQAAIAAATAPLATSSALTAATAGLATPASVSASIAAATPSPCPAPSSDTLAGSSGTGACMARPDSTRPTAVQAINATLGTDCSWSVTFGRPTTSSAPIVHANVQLATNATQPIPCAATSRSTTAAAGKCFPGQTTALNLSIITAGLSLSPFGSVCTALPVMVVVREPTQ